MRDLNPKTSLYWITNKITTNSMQIKKEEKKLEPF